MDSFEFNKIAGAVLGTLLLTMALGLFSGFVFSPPIPSKPGYELPNAAAEAAPAEASTAAQQPLLPAPITSTSTSAITGTRSTMTVWKRRATAR